MKELTITSVYHSTHSKRFLELNRDLVDSINLRHDFSWIAVDNTPHDFKEEKIDSTKFKVLQGVPLVEYQKTLEPWQDPFKVSMHWGYAMNMAMRQVDTRFVLILDGDFYILQKDWIEKVLSYMKEHKLALLGAPWHPRWIKKPRYFPTVHALFIDARQIPLASLDFQPQYGSPDELPIDTELQKLKVPPSFLSVLRSNMRLRKYVGSSKDSSREFYERYKESPFRFETFTPVFKPYAEDNILERFIKLWIDTILPDRYSLTPRIGTYTKKTFRERGYFDASQFGWEEFVWKNKPFGFHMRNTGNAKRDKDKDLQMIEKVLADFKIHPVV